MSNATPGFVSRRLVVTAGLIGLLNVPLRAAGKAPPLYFGDRLLNTSNLAAVTAPRA